MAMFNWAEIRRWQDMKNPGSVNTDPLFGYNSNDTNTDVGYPKGLFDKLNYAKDEKVTRSSSKRRLKTADWPWSPSRASWCNTAPPASVRSRTWPRTWRTRAPSVCSTKNCVCEYQ